MNTIVGEALPQVARLDVREGSLSALEPAGCRFALRGSTGHLRYVLAHEKGGLAAVTPPLGRDTATCAALIPIRKSAAWWELAQDERRVILQERSKHISLGLGYLPAVARRLYHCRELGEPFDFVTWFEHAPEDSERFDELVYALRASEEWQYVEREVDIRLMR